MISTHNPFAAREYISTRLRVAKSRATTAEELRAAHLRLLEELDTAIGQAISTGEEAQVMAYESAKEYLQEQIG